MTGGQDSSGDAHEIDVVPATPAAPRTGLMLGGAIAVLVVALVGAFFAVNAQDEPTEVDVAAPDAEVVEDAPMDDALDDADSDGDDAGDTEPEAEAMEDDEESSSGEDVMQEAADSVEFATSAAIGFGGPNNVLHTDDGFVSIGWGPDGLAVSRSADGTEWSSTPIDGLPQNSNLVGIAEYSGGFVTVLEVWPEPADDVEGPIFGPPAPPERLLATTSDLVTWETSPIPEVGVEAGGFSHVSGMAVSGDVIAIQVQVEPAHLDEVQLLFEEGLLSEADMENYCGARFDSPDEVIIIMTCDWEAQEQIYREFEQKMDAAESDEERAALEEEFFGDGLEPGTDELFRLEPGDPIHTKLIEAYTVEPEMVPAIILSGPIGGDYTQTQLPVEGYTSAMAGSDAGFLTIVHDWADGVVTSLRSTDGATWTEATPLGEQMDVQGLAVTGDLIVAVANRWDGAEDTLAVLATSDLGTTWSDAGIGSELFGGWGSPLSGPAGIAIMVEGSTEPYPEFVGPESISAVTEDGYTLEIRFADDVMILTDPAGTVVHEVPGIVNEEPDGGEIEGVLRFDGPFGSDLVFLDPATGEDLASFGEDEFEAAWEASFEPQEPSFEEPPHRSELWFSADGVTWELIEATDVDHESNSWTSLVAVGDDEVVVRTETWTEPPAELFAFEEEGRDPSDEELAALESWEAENYVNNVEWRRIPVG